MGSNKYQKMLLNAKRICYNTSSVVCLALNNEEVSFGNTGYRHLIRKGRKNRPIPDQIRRFTLLPYAPEVIRHGKLIEHRTIPEEIVTEESNCYFKVIHFWTISHFVEGRNLRVTIIQSGNGKKHFLSIMDSN